MMKILTIIGARPQIIKASAISRAIKNCFQDKIEEIIIHTGQHYDENMSNVFFTEMQIPEPKYNLKIGSSSHGKQTGDMIKGIEEIIENEKPDAIVLFGDTNSTLSGAIAASKLHIPVIHIEAGLRSFNKSMPEEINRILCDHVSTLLFSPSQQGIVNLKNEGFDIETIPPYSNDNPAVFHCGDIMYDNSLYFSELAEKNDNILSRNQLEAENYILTTIHRDNNTDDPKRLNSIFSAIYKISEDYKLDFILPLHPRTSKILKTNLSTTLYNNIIDSNFIKIIEPVGFLEMIILEKNSKMVFTDSGGVQKESYFFKKNCVILRPETEWVELVENGNAIIADADENKILEAYKILSERKITSFPEFYGNGKAAEFICGKILECII
jgi:UDP-GlcNAc3NAcA epimerase